MVRSHTFSLNTDGRKLYPITDIVVDWFSENSPNVGLLNLYIQHTSASLLIQENADPTAKSDLEAFLERLVPEGEAWHKHTLEGPDDTTAHMKASLTPTSLSIPINDGKLMLGTWQGIYLWEHRQSSHTRKIHATVLGEG